MVTRGRTENSPDIKQTRGLQRNYSFALEKNNCFVRSSPSVPAEMLLLDVAGRRVHKWLQNPSPTLPQLTGKGPEAKNHYTESTKPLQKPACIYINMNLLHCPNTIPFTATNSIYNTLQL